MTRILSCIFLSVVLLFQVSSAFGKKIERTCTAYYSLDIRRAAQQYGGPIVPLVKMFTFKAKGSCGSTVPNRCRERARDAAVNCMDLHYNNDYHTTYANNKAPYYCSPHRRIYDYHINQLAGKISDTACKAIPSSLRPGTFKVKVIARVEGKKGCAEDTPLRQPDANYPEWRQVYCP